VQSGANLINNLSAGGMIGLWLGLMGLLLGLISGEALKNILR